jgi:hypothetical protein
METLYKQGGVMEKAKLELTKTKDIKFTLNLILPQPTEVKGV